MPPGHRGLRLRGRLRLTSLLLGRRVRIRSSHRAVGEYLVAVLGRPEHASVSGDSELEVCFRPAAGGDLSVSVGDAPAFTATVDDAPPRALEALNRRLCFSPGPFVTVHAAVAARGRGAVVLLGGSGAGKSTLVAGLTRAGWTYFSDDAAGIDESGNVHPYSRPIMLRPDTWSAFPDLAKRLPAGHDRFASSEWHVPPALLGSVADGPAPPGAVVEIRYEEGVRAELQPVGRGEALERMAAHGCNLNWYGQDGLERLARAVRQADCYRLVFGDLADAVAALDRLG